MDQNPLLNYKFQYESNHCLVCGIKISEDRLFCADHDPLLQVRIDMKVSELKSGQFGYVACKDMFAIGQALYIYNDSIVKATPDDVFMVKISKSGKNLSICVEMLEPHRFGVLDTNWAYTEVIPLGTLPEFKSATSKKAADLQIGDEGYIEPRFVYYYVGDLYIHPSTETATAMNIEQSVRIIRDENGFKIDYTTLRDEDLRYPLPDSKCRDAYIPAILF